MPALRNQRHERFAVEVAAMTPLDRAYVAAGHRETSAKYNASRLANHPKVAARINELGREFAMRSGIHAEYLQRLLLPLAEANVQDLYIVGPDGQERLTPRQSGRLQIHQLVE
jgi:phage terminase small subunit